MTHSGLKVSPYQAAIAVLFLAFHSLFCLQSAQAESKRYLVQYRANERFPSALLSDDEIDIPNVQIVKRNRRGRLVTANLSESDVEALERNQHVESVEPDREVRVLYTPNDTLLSDLDGLIGMLGIRAPQAWDVAQGRADQIVAIIDTGIDYNHPDLSGNVWTNPGETPNDGVDNDGNGYIDDFYGYDFAGNDPDPMDVFGHGTHVAGTVAATGDNAQGVVGVSFKTRVLAAKPMGDSGSGAYSDIVESIDYVVALKKRGIPIVAMNLSLGASDYSNAWYRALQRAREADIIVIAAAGNSGEDADVFPMYPAAFDLPNIVSVAAITGSGGLASFSNYGRTSVDVAAPGVNILSTFPMDGGAPTYDYKSGTSMASPHVAGLAALIASANPSLTARQIRALIISTVRPLRSLKERCQTGGTVDAAKAVTTALNKPRRLEVYGKVRTARGAPVADVTVVVRPLGGRSRSRRAVSQADGSFIVTGIPPGNYVISASRANTNFKRRAFSTRITSDYKVLFTTR